MIQYLGTGLVVATLIGCANIKPPVDVALIPNDCANRLAIIKWLESQADSNSTIFANKEKHEQYQSSVKTRIWNLRYNCQPV